MIVFAWKDVKGRGLDTPSLTLTVDILPSKLNCFRLIKVCQIESKFILKKQHFLFK